MAATSNQLTEQHSYLQNKQNETKLHAHKVYDNFPFKEFIKLRSST